MAGGLHRGGSDPARDLKDLGLSTELARYAGRPIYVPRNATHDPHFAGFFSHITERRLATFYLTHPGRTLALFHRGATASMDLRPYGVSPPLGNETVDAAAAPQYAACKLCVYSSVSQALRPASAVLVPALWAAALVTGWALALGRRREETRAIGLSLLLVLAFAVMSMAVALLGEGEFEIVKHLYLTSACDALLAAFTVHGVALLVQGRRLTRAAEPAAAVPESGCRPAATAL